MFPKFCLEGIMSRSGVDELGRMEEAPSEEKRELMTWLGGLAALLVGTLIGLAVWASQGFK